MESKYAKNVAVCDREAQIVTMIYHSNIDTFEVTNVLIFPLCIIRTGWRNMLKPLSGSYKIIIFLVKQLNILFIYFIYNICNEKSKYFQNYT
jgi:hypothetical protein